MVMNTSGRRLGLLAVAFLVSPAGGYTDDSGTECIPEFYADGDCDQANNRAECGYDSGDCCSCTCVNGEFRCGLNGFACVDPQSECVDDDDVTVDLLENCGNVGGIGNGYCDQENNNELCGYDGGDCCQCTCETPENNYDWDDDWRCSASGSGFACIDPSAPCVDDDDVTMEMVENCGYIGSIGDGYCDTANNNEICDFDGGDCCECTCVAPDTSWDDDYACNPSGSGFACIDPSASCVDDDDVTVEVVENCGYAQGIGNGDCDHINNKEECGFDGGDCCECTCVAPENSYTYGDDYSWYGWHHCNADSFACIDPEAPCVDDDDVTADMVENCGYVQGIGNGDCDHINNKEECGFDGGDCCSCTCTEPETSPNDSYYGGSYQACGNGFACIDPSAPCVDDDDITTDIVEDCDPVSVGNAYCDQGNNTPECNYDGGDCCSCTCEDTPNQECGQWSGFACIDPSAQCVNDDDITVDMFEHCWGGIGDGFCNPDNNKPECNYDGGDCCECTCQVSHHFTDDYTEGQWAGCYSFACIDPEAPCVDDDSITQEIHDNCPNVQFMGDGYCDIDLNNADCLFDGGDCCSCTCELPSDDDYGCHGIDCRDPDAACFGEESNMDDDGFWYHDDDSASMSYKFVTSDDDGGIATTDAEENSGLRVELAPENLFLGITLGFVVPLWAFSTY